MGIRARLITLASVLTILLTFTSLFVTMSGLKTPGSAVFNAGSEDQMESVSVFVQFKTDSLSDEYKNSWGQKYGLAYYQQTVPAPGEVNQFLLYYNLLGANRILEWINNDHEVAWAEFQGIAEPTFTPNDTQFSSSWHLNSARLGAQEAWDISSGKNVTIAILDTGVDCTHLDLSCVAGWNIYNNNSDTSDVLGHGTNVAGSAAEIGNNSAYTTGVAGEAKIMPVRISDPNGNAYMSTIAVGLRWASDRGVRVANNSYKTGKSLTIQAAAQNFAALGGVLTIGAGNDNILEAGPGNPYALIIGATNPDGTKWAGSTRGVNYLSYTAPTNILTTQRGGGVASRTGTSFSAPVAAGLVALMKASKPSLSFAETKEIIGLTATDLGAPGPDDLFGGGEINFARAMQEVRNRGGSINTYVPPPQCSDGIDNDADGLIDYPIDAGCSNTSDNDETNAAPPPPPPQCSDGIDNDGDGLIDHPNDPGCSSTSDNDETNATTSSSGAPSNPAPTAPSTPSTPSTPSQPEEAGIAIPTPARGEEYKAPTPSPSSPKSTSTTAKSDEKTEVAQSDQVEVKSAQTVETTLNEPENPQYFGRVLISGKTLPNTEVELLVMPASKRFSETSNADGEFEFKLKEQLEIGSYTAAARVISPQDDMPYSNSVTIEVVEKKMNSITVQVAVAIALLLGGGLLLAYRTILPRLLKSKFV